MLSFNDITGAVSDGFDAASDFAGDVTDTVTGTIADGASAGAEFAGDLFEGAVAIGGEAAGFAGDVFGGVFDFTTGTVGVLTDLIGNVFVGGAELATEAFDFVADGAEGAAQSVESILAGIADALGLQNLEGMDVYSILFLLMSRLEEQQSGAVENLALLTERKGVLEQEAFKKSIGEPNQHDALLARPEFQNLDTNINLLTSQLQRTESLRQQLNTMVSNLQRADHEAKMVTLRNIPTR